MTSNSTRQTAHTSWKILAFLWVLLLLLDFQRPMALPDEARYGEVGRWMAQSGDWLIPRLNGIPFFHKPPYLYWLEGLSVSLFGAHTWALRWVVSLHAGLLMAMIYVFTRRFHTEIMARNAAIFFGTSLACLIGGQYVNHDMVVATWISTAILCFALAFSEDVPNRAWAWAGFASCGWGLMTKGLIGVALPGAVLLMWLIWTRQLRKLLRLPWVTGLGLFGLITLPWFLAAEQSHPGMARYIFIAQQFNRYVSSGFNNPQPLWFYPAVIFVLGFPWVFFALHLAVRALRKKSADPAAEETASDTSLYWLWLIVITLFFSIPRSKLIGYILPVMPAVAILSAIGFQRWTSRGFNTSRVLWVLGAIQVSIALAVGHIVTQVTRDKSTEDIAQTLACAWRSGDRLYAAGMYPYDLPFHLQSLEPMTVVMDWPHWRQQAGDSWHRELFEGTEFEPGTDRLLQEAQALDAALQQPGQWLVMRNEDAPAAAWLPIQRGRAWTLYRSPAERPEAPQQKGLPGCKHHRDQQG